MIVYRSFYESIRDLPKETQADLWSAIFEYGLNLNEVELSGVANSMWKLIKPQLDANIKRYQNGSRPKQTGSKQEAKPKQDVIKSEANKNVNKNLNLNVNEECKSESKSEMQLSENKVDEIKDSSVVKYHDFKTPEEMIENMHNDWNWQTKLLKTNPINAVQYRKAVFIFVTERWETDCQKPLKDVWYHFTNWIAKNIKRLQTEQNGVEVDITPSGTKVIKVNRRAGT